jgi:type IV secretory pathway VirB2 component (pilin)
LRLAGIVAVISIILAGIGYITAAGNAEKITSSRKRIVNSVLGLAIVFVAAAVVSFIGNSLG